MSRPRNWRAGSPGRTGRPRLQSWVCRERPMSFSVTNLPQLTTLSPTAIPSVRLSFQAGVTFHEGPSYVLPSNTRVRRCSADEQSAESPPRRGDTGRSGEVEDENNV